MILNGVSIFSEVGRVALPAELGALHVEHDRKRKQESSETTRQTTTSLQGKPVEHLPSEQ